MSISAIGNLSQSPSALTLRVAEIRSQTFSSLVSTLLGDEEAQGTSSFDAIFGTGTTAAEEGLSPAGRNMTLHDPESAYRMMTLINAKEVDYKAEFAEMSDMKSELLAMRDEALGLGGIDASASAADIRARLEEFAEAYNGWIDRFDESLAPGGLLAATQAAHVSQWELEQSVENIFNGVAEGGVRGMQGLGFETDPVTNMLRIDAGKLDAALASDKAGAVATVQAFSKDFARAVELLNSEGNFVPNRLDNLDRVIDYIADNRTSLQAEFGLGDPAKPSGKTAQALASYNAISGLAA